MNKLKQTLSCVLTIIGLILFSGCATSHPPKPLTYAATTRPAGPIKSSGQRVEIKQSRGHFYFVNYGFRPAPDICAYLKKAQTDAGAEVLRNADVKLTIPFAFDILLFGVQFGSDTVTANQ